MSALGEADWPVAGHTVLQVPVPPLEAFVRARTAHYDPAWLSADPTFGHAHVTVLGPFVPPASITASTLSVISEIACGTAPFTFVLRRVDTFPNGIIHLLPEPEEPFRDLTRRVCAAFPAYPPYAGEFPSPRPHLTLDARSETVSAQTTAASLGGQVPAACRADRLDLALWQQNGCRVLASWAFSGRTR